MNTYEIFTEMRKLPKGYIIEDPYGLIQTHFKITDKILHILKTKDNSVFFTRLSIKHLSEKVIDGEYIFSKIKQILKEPDRIHVGNFSNRFLISKDILFNNSLKAHIVNLEINKKTGNIIVTGFISREDYFKNLRLLWGTASSPSQQLPKE
jgi:hypothetical protein